MAPFPAAVSCASQRSYHILICLLVLLMEPERNIAYGRPVLMSTGMTTGALTDSLTDYEDTINPAECPVLQKVTSPGKSSSFDISFSDSYIVAGVTIYGHKGKTRSLVP